MELKVTRPIGYPLTQTLSVAHKQPGICLFHPKAIENIRNSYMLIPLRLNFEIYSISNEILLKLKSAKNGFQLLSRKNWLVHPGLEPTCQLNHKALIVMRLRPLGYLDTTMRTPGNLWWSFYYNVSQLWA